jgi:hypothetical protein
VTSVSRDDIPEGIVAVVDGGAGLGRPELAFESKTL